MNQKGEILIVTTGGTIDKVYFDAQSAFAVGDPQIEEVLRQAHVDLPYRVCSLMRKDSLDLTEADRLEIRDTLARSAHERVLLTHGTDTMTDTACFLESLTGKTIVLTGALLPARFRDNDAIFNIGFALAALQILPHGVYIAINGRVYDPRRVRKDRQQNRFVAVSRDRT